MRTALFVLLLTATAACSDNGKPAVQDGGSTAEDGAPFTRTAGSKACDLLTWADAEKALGRAVAKLDNQGGSAGQDICQYGYQGERLTDMGNISVTVEPVDLASVIEGAKAQGYVLEPVEGVGDAAWYSADVGLYVGKGQRTAHYLLGANGLADPKPKLVALAKETVGRL
jgi:hypothetical protein